MVSGTIEMSAASYKPEIFFLNHLCNTKVQERLGVNGRNITPFLTEYQRKLRGGFPPTFREKEAVMTVALLREMAPLGNGKPTHLKTVVDKLN